MNRRKITIFCLIIIQLLIVFNSVSYVCAGSIQFDQPTVIRKQTKYILAGKFIILTEHPVICTRGNLYDLIGLLGNFNAGTTCQSNNKSDKEITYENTDQNDHTSILDKSDQLSSSVTPNKTDKTTDKSDKVDKTTDKLDKTQNEKNNSNGKNNNTVESNKISKNDAVINPDKNNGNYAQLNSDEIFWLARIIQAEAGNEPYEGKLAVGNVIINRVKNPDYPSTIYGVIFDNKYGVQFTPTVNGTIYNDPSDESLSAAKQILSGFSLNDEMLYFVNHDLSSSNWFYSKTFVFKIGKHSFYS